MSAHDPVIQPIQHDAVLSIQHDTLYRYDAPVAQAHHLGYLRPRSEAWQLVEAFVLEVSPEPDDLTLAFDVFGNARSTFSVWVPHQMLHVRARSRVRLGPRPHPLGVDEGPAWEAVAHCLRHVPGAPYLPATEYRFASPCVPLYGPLRPYALRSFVPGRSLWAAAIDLMHRIHRDIAYDASDTGEPIGFDGIFARRRGNCRDMAHVLIGCLRVLGLAARYVSGYRIPGLRADDGASAPITMDMTHAWVSVYCPPSLSQDGWLDLDCAANTVAGSQHVVLAQGRDASDVRPLRAVLPAGVHVESAVRVLVAPISQVAEEPGAD